LPSDRRWHHGHTESSRIRPELRAGPKAVQLVGTALEETVVPSHPKLPEKRLAVRLVDVVLARKIIKLTGVNEIER